MRVVLQRVSKAAVSVNGKTVGEIRHGFAALIGVALEDTVQEAEWMANKISGLRVFEDGQGKMNLSVLDVEGSVLVISQFTLYGDARKGRRPSFTQAAPPEIAEPLVEAVSKKLADRGVPVASGVFGARMQLEIHNDGPVTIILEK